jgi:hypothetical protein
MPDGNKDAKQPADAVGYDNGRVISADEYFKRVRHTPVRGCKWSAAEWRSVLAELGKDPIRHAERRFCSLINEDHGDVAIYHYLQGTGFTTVEGVRYPYAKGDTIVCPAWAYHKHEATGDEDTIMYVTQDMTEMAAKRTLFFEEPEGLQNVRHMVQGTSKSWSATRDPTKE